MWRESEAEKNLLRTHTTAVSSKMLYRLAQVQPGACLPSMLSRNMVHALPPIHIQSELLCMQRPCTLMHALLCLCIAAVGGNVRIEYAPGIIVFMQSMSVHSKAGHTIIDMRTPHIAGGLQAGQVLLHRPRVQE